MRDDEAVDILRRSDRVAYTEHTKTTIRAIMAEIHLARSRGFALTAQESTLGDITVAAPVRRADGSTTAAVNISVSVTEWKVADVMRKLGPTIRDVAHAVSEASEFRPALMAAAL
jgi:DNA-binding IclR family transcriptional regulator